MTIYVCCLQKVRWREESLKILGNKEADLSCNDLEIQIKSQVLKVWGKRKCGGLCRNTK